MDDDVTAGVEKQRREAACVEAAAVGEPRCFFTKPSRYGGLGCGDEQSGEVFIVGGNFLRLLHDKTTINWAVKAMSPCNR